MDAQERAVMEQVRRRFAEARFLEHVGITLEGLGRGWAETALVVGPQHGQAQGFVHAGVQATMADHTAGTAGGTLVGDDQAVLTVEMKLNLLRPAVGKSLRCRAEVVKAGKSLMFCEAKVHAGGADGEKLVATFTSTLAVVAAPSGASG